MTITHASQDLRTALDAAPMRALQWQAIALCFFINMVDGIDVLVMAFTASSVAKEWQLSQVAVGWLLSAGIIGMTLGSLFLAPLADRLGRRPVVIAGLVSAGAFMVATEWVNDPWTLGTLRLLTGIGIGAVLVQANVLTSEYANAKWRAFAIGLQSVGFALGATVGGMGAAYLNAQGTWHDVFVWGGVLSWLCAAAVAYGLPESLDFLMHSSRHNSRNKAQHLLLQMKHAITVPQEALQRSTESHGVLGGLKLLCAAGSFKTWLLGTSFFALMFCFYFVTSWTPKLLEQTGLSAERGIAGGVLLHVGGMAGALALGAFASRWQLQRVAQWFMVLGSVALVFVVPATDWTLAPAMLLGVSVGLLINGSVAGIYATAPQTYDASSRSSGVGIVLSFGRLGGIASPVVAGYLLDGNWSINSVYMLYAVVLLLAAGLLLAFTRVICK